MKTLHSESMLQRQCFTWFRLQYPKLALNLVAIPNGGQRSQKEAAIMSGEGVVPGVADAVLFIPSYVNQTTYHTLCIEFKTVTKTVGRDGKVTERKTYQSEAQKAWQAAVEATHNKYVVVRSLEEFMAEIKAYFVKPSGMISAMALRAIGIPF